MTNTYFWENLIKHDPIEMKGWMKGREYIEYKLIEDKGCINLNDLQSAYYETYIPSIDNLKDWDSPANKEKFLAYLLPLLKEGKLKVKIRDLKLEAATEEQKKKYGESLSSNFRNISSIKDHIDLLPQQAIDMIRERWNSVTEEDRDHFESWGVLFTLPENEWII